MDNDGTNNSGQNINHDPEQLLDALVSRLAQASSISSDFSNINQFEQEHPHDEAVNPGEIPESQQNAIDNFGTDANRITHVMNDLVSELSEINRRFSSVGPDSYQHYASQHPDSSGVLAELSRMRTMGLSSYSDLSSWHDSMNQISGTADNAQSQLRNGNAIDQGGQRYRQNQQAQVRQAGQLANHMTPSNQNAYASALQQRGITPMVYSEMAGQEFERNQRSIPQTNRQETMARAHFINDPRDAIRRAQRDNYNIAHARRYLSRVHSRAYTDSNGQYHAARGRTVTESNDANIGFLVDRALNGNGSRNGALQHLRDMRSLLNGGTDTNDQYHTGRSQALQSALSARHRAISNLEGESWFDNSNVVGHGQNAYLNQNGLDQVNQVATDRSGTYNQRSRNYAQSYLNHNSEVTGLREQINSLASAINSLSAQVRNLNVENSSYNQSKTTNMAQARANPGATYVSAPPYSLRAMYQSMGQGIGISSLFGYAALRGILSASGQGSSLRTAEEPGINSQTIGGAINGNPVGYHLDDRIQDALNQSGRALGENSRDMSAYMNAATGARNTNPDANLQAAENMARFSRENNVNPQDTSELFTTLGQAGGLGNDTSGNVVDLSRQFAGMLHNSHLGGISNQQAQGLNSIYGSMIGSGQTVTPNDAGNIMAMQSVLSHGAGGQVFQGQQGAQQLNSFSHGVGSSFNNMLIRNAFAGNNPRYGGQQGLYRLQMDMQEPLKHPTALNNMISNMSNTGLGPAGTEDALTQMGLGPEAARKIYNASMRGQLTQGYLNQVKARDRSTGRSTQRHARRQYHAQGNSTLDIKVALDQQGHIHTSEALDSARHEANRIHAPFSQSGPGSMLWSGLGSVGNIVNTVGNMRSVLELILGRNGSFMSGGLAGLGRRGLYRLGRTRLGTRARNSALGRRLGRSRLGRWFGNRIGSNANIASGAGNHVNNTFVNNTFTNNHGLGGGLNSSDSNSPFSPSDDNGNVNTESDDTGGTNPGGSDLDNRVQDARHGDVDGRGPSSESDLATVHGPNGRTYRINPNESRLHTPRQTVNDRLRNLRTPSLNSIPIPERPSLAEQARNEGRNAPRALHEAGALTRPERVGRSVESAAQRMRRIPVLRHISPFVAYAGQRYAINRDLGRPGLITRGLSRLERDRNGNVRPIVNRVRPYLWRGRQGIRRLRGLPSYARYRGNRFLQDHNIPERARNIYSRGRNALSRGGQAAREAFTRRFPNAVNSYRNARARGLSILGRSAEGASKPGTAFSEARHIPMNLQMFSNPATKAARTGAKGARVGRTANGLGRSLASHAGTKLALKGATRLGSDISGVGDVVNAGFQLNAAGQDLKGVNGRNIGAKSGQAIGDALEAIPGANLLPLRTLGGMAGFTLQHPIKAAGNLIKSPFKAASWLGHKARNGLGHIGNFLRHPIRDTRNGLGHIGHGIVSGIGHVGSFLRHPLRSIGRGLGHLSGLHRTQAASLAKTVVYLGLINRLLPHLASRLASLGGFEPGLTGKTSSTNTSSGTANANMSSGNVANISNDYGQRNNSGNTDNSRHRDDHSTTNNYYMSPQQRGALNTARRRNGGIGNYLQTFHHPEYS